MIVGDNATQDRPALEANEKAEAVKHTDSPSEITPETLRTRVPGRDPFWSRTTGDDRAGGRNSRPTAR
jgi:hypothetical protein